MIEMDEREQRYPVRAAAYVLGVTPALIYSYFKDRHWPVNGGLTEFQLVKVADHIEHGKRTKPYKHKTSDIAAVLSVLNARPGAQQIFPIGEDNENKEVANA